MRRSKAAVAGSEGQPDKSYEFRVPVFEFRVSRLEGTRFQDRVRARWAKHTLRFILRSIVNQRLILAIITVRKQIRLIPNCATQRFLHEPSQILLLGSVFASEHPLEIPAPLYRRLH